MLRQFVTVAILLGIMVALPLLADPGTGTLHPLSMAAFGFIVIAAYTLGEMAGRIRLPHITGYLVTGLLCGPHVFGLLTERAIHDLELFDTLAVALIGTSAGGALRLSFFRRNAGPVLGVLGFQFVAVIGLVTLLLFLAVTRLPVLGLHLPAEQGWPLALAAALLVATVASAFSPAATIAVIHESRSRGPVTDNVLGISVLNNVVVVVLFGVVLAVAGLLLGDGGEEPVVVQLLIRIGGSIGLGLAGSLVTALYIRFVRSELLLYVVGLGFTMTFMAQELDLDPVLTFITIGFAVRNFSRSGDTLLQVVDQVALPVYVVFFFVAGAGLHVDALATMWPAALLLFVGRGVALLLGTRIGVRLSQGPEGLARYGWMGFVPQAGIALSLAVVVGHRFEGWGPTVETLIVAGVALNELFGPAFLQFSLGLVGESEAARKAGEASDTPEEDPVPTAEEEIPEAPGHGLPEWLPEPGRPYRDPWGPLPEVREERLVDAARTIKAELQGLVRDIRSGPVARRREQGVRFLGLLRREFLRAHRHSFLAISGNDADTSWSRVLQRERAELARRWERLILDRAATVDFRAELTTLRSLVSAVDALPDLLPEAVEESAGPEYWAPRPGDPPHVAAIRLVRRVQHRARNLVGGDSRWKRVVEVRALARYAFSGRIPSNLLEPAGLLSISERHLLDRARNVFEVYHRALDRLAAAEAPPEDLLQRLDTIRTEMEDDFALAFREVDRMADDTVRVTASALGRSYREYVHMLEVAGSVDLPARRYRFSKVFDDRQHALERIQEGLSSSRDLTRGVASGLAMELEMLRLTTHLGDEVQQAADSLARDVRGRITIQLQRVSETMTRSVEDLRQLLDTPETDKKALQEGIEAATSPLLHVLSEALSISEELRAGLKNEAVLEPLVRELNREVDQLTDRFEVVTHPPPARGRALPPRIPVRELPFQEAVRAFVDSEVVRDLSLLVSNLRQRAEEAHRGLDEVERVSGFNTDLARAELEVLPEGPVPEATLALLREMLVGTLQRLSNRVNALRAAGGELSEQARAGVHGAVIENLESLQQILVEGRFGELRLRMAQETMAAGRQEIRGFLRELAGGAEQLGAAIGVAAGPRTIRRTRRILGLAPTEEAGELDGLPIEPPPEQVPIPTVYRRLFSDKALEAGDLLLGREREVDQVRRILQGAGRGHSRAIAVVGIGGVSNTAVVNALIRGLPSEGGGLHRVELTRPVDAEAVHAKILTPAEEHPGSIIILDGFHWLFSIRPGGFEPLRTFLDGVVSNHARNGWLFNTDRAVWSYVSQVVPMRDVFPEQVHFGPLDEGDLRRSILLRHAMSGYDLRFRPPPGRLDWWLRSVMSRGSGEEEAWEEHFFQLLHRASRGVLGDAQRLWLASISAVGSSTDTITITTLPAPPLDRLRMLPEEILLTLRQVARQGRIDPADHARQFRWETGRSEGFLARLEHRGLLSRSPLGCYRFSPALAGPIYQVLRERRLVG